MKKKLNHETPSLASSYDLFLNSETKPKNMLLTPMPIEYFLLSYEGLVFRGSKLDLLRSEPPKLKVLINNNKSTIRACRKKIKGEG